MTTRTRRKPARYNDDEFEMNNDNENRKTQLDEDRSRSNSPSHRQDRSRSTTPCRRSKSADSDRSRSQSSERSSSESRVRSKRTKRSSRKRTRKLEKQMKRMQESVSEIRGFLLSTNHSSPPPQHHQDRMESQQRSRTRSPSRVTQRSRSTRSRSPTTSARSETRMPQDTLEFSGMDENPLAPAFLPPPRPVVTAGVEIGAHVPPNVKAKIWRDEYVEFAHLLPSTTYQQQSYTLSLDPGSRSNFGIKVQKPKPNNLSFDQWMDAFIIYMGIYTAKHNVAPAMCTYLRDVKSLAVRGANFRHYDEQFRVYRQTTHCSWAELHYGIWFQATQPIRQNNNNNKSNQGWEKTGQNKSSPFHVPRGFCVHYHSRGKFCKNSQKCTYKHTCPKCSEKHPMYFCETNTKTSSDNSNGQQQPPYKKPSNTNQTR